MKVKFHLLLISFYMLSASLYAGDIDRLEVPIWIYENGFTPIGTSFWASGGAGIANPSNAEVLLYNPAFKTKTTHVLLVGGLRQFEKRFAVFEDSEVKIGASWHLPSYLLFARRFKSGLLFFGYQNIYSFKKKFTFEIATLEHPEGTGESLTNIEEQTMQNFFVGFNRPFFRRFNLGINIGLLRYLFSGEMDQRKIDSNASYSYALNFGLSYEMNDQVNVSLIYRYFDPLKYKFKLEAPLVSGNYDSIEYVMTESERPFRLPWVLNLGFYFKPFNSLQLMFKTEYQEWRKVSTYYENRLQLALGVTFAPSEKWQVNFGAFTCGQYPKKDYGIEDTPFVTTGIDYWLKPGLKFSISALSNTFFVKRIHDNTKQIDRSQILFGMQWAFGAIKRFKM